MSLLSNHFTSCNHSGPFLPVIFSFVLFQELLKLTRVTQVHWSLMSYWWIHNWRQCLSSPRNHQYPIIQQKQVEISDLPTPWLMIDPIFPKTLMAGTVSMHIWLPWVCHWEKAALHSLSIQLSSLIVSSAPFSIVIVEPQKWWFAWTLSGWAFNYHFYSKLWAAMHFCLYCCSLKRDTDERLEWHRISRKRKVRVWRGLRVVNGDWSQVYCMRGE